MISVPAPVACCPNGVDGWWSILRSLQVEASSCFRDLFFCPVGSTHRMMLGAALLALCCACRPLPNTSPGSVTAMSQRSEHCSTLRHLETSIESVQHLWSVLVIHINRCSGSAFPAGCCKWASAQAAVSTSGVVMHDLAPRLYVLDQCLLEVPVPRLGCFPGALPKCSSNSSAAAKHARAPRLDAISVLVVYSASGVELSHCAHVVFPQETGAWTGARMHVVR